MADAGSVALRPVELLQSDSCYRYYLVSAAVITMASAGAAAALRRGLDLTNT